MTEQVHLQIRLHSSHSIVLLCQFHTKTVQGILRLFQRREEAVQVGLIRIDGERLLSFGLDIHRPAFIVVLQHLNAVESYLLGLCHSLCYIQLTHIFQFPISESWNRDSFSCKIAVIRTIAQSSVRIVEIHILKASLLQGAFDTVFRHTRHFIVYFQRSTCR